MKLVSIKNWLPIFQFVELHKFADAKTITNTVIEELKKSTLYPALQQKLLSFTSDGKNWCRKMRLARQAFISTFVWGRRFKVTKLAFIFQKILIKTWMGISTWKSSDFHRFWAHYWILVLFCLIFINREEKRLLPTAGLEPTASNLPEISPISLVESPTLPDVSKHFSTVFV